MSAVIVSGVFEDSWPAISSVVLMLVKTMALVVTFRVESLLNTGLKPISIACVAAAEYTGLTARPPSTPDQGAIFLIVTVVAMAFQHEVIKSASSKFCTLIFPCACTCSPVKRLRAQKFDAAFLHQPTSLEVCTACCRSRTVSDLWSVSAKTGGVQRTIERLWGQSG